MTPGSVIVDLAVSSGGNCPLSEVDKVVVKHSLTLVGVTNFPALVPSDASNFYARNLINLLFLIIKPGEPPTLNMDLQDEIVAASLATQSGTVRFKRK